MGAGLQEVEFHTGVADPVAFACRLLRKACRQGARVLVTADDAALSELDRALWVFDEREFLPHVRVPGAAGGVAARTPLWLAPGAEPVLGLAGAPRVLLNLGAEAPAVGNGLERIIEVVAADPEATAAGRQRWRAYRQAGLAIRHHQTARDAGAGHE